ncbi:MAG: hypothetical protein VXW59_08675 [Actinomycetota bacterium]|nr:hypothetical protein [Actinomycetota bacterium]
MDIADALRVLGLSDAPDWSDVRAAHRRAIVRTHPDAGGSDGDAAQVNQAFDLLRKISGNGERPIPGGAPAPPTAPVPGPRSTSPDQLVADDDPVELLLRMADAAHEIGEVVFVDPHDGLLEVIVGDPPGVGQLTATVDEATPDGVPVSFTLEPLGIASAPSIHEIVEELMALVRRRRRSAHRRSPEAGESPR